MNPAQPHDQPPVCDYTDSDYQATFWDSGERRYEDAVEEIALSRLLTEPGKLLLELGAGAGRNTPRYKDFERIVLLDYSRTQLLQARERLGQSDRYVFVAADIYKLPFVPGLFDGATMIRTLHHMADPLLALQNVRKVMQENAVFILEFANKRNLKAIARWVIGRQKWNPFKPDQVEFVPLNYNFHPASIRRQAGEAGFELEKQLSVSHFRSAWTKKNIPHDALVGLDAALQPTGSWWQYSPSIFSRLRAKGPSPAAASGSFFACPICSHPLPEVDRNQICPGCGREWEYRDGIYEFRINPQI